MRGNGWRSRGKINALVFVAVMDSHSPGTNFITKAIRSFPLEEYIENNVLLKCQPVAFKEKRPPRGSYGHLNLLTIDRQGHVTFVMGKQGEGVRGGGEGVNNSEDSPAHRSC